MRPYYKFLNNYYKFNEKLYTKNFTTMQEIDKHIKSKKQQNEFV